jgi:CRISPR-associated endonuclease Cas1
MAAVVPASRIERRRDWTLPATPRRKDGEIVVADGYGLQIRINRGHLVINDGIAGEGRRERRYGRATSNVSHLVVLGGSGSLSLDAIRWLADVGASLVCIDRDGSVMVTSAPTKAEAKLRRAQALAPYNDSGLAVGRELLRRKLEGQLQVHDRLRHPEPYPRRVLERCLAALGQAGTIEELVVAEAEGAGAYWGAWADVEVRFQPADQRRVSEEWRRFGTRSSPIGSGPRLAVNPAGAILNYLYALLEAEARLACFTLGLDPALAVVHADIRGRDSLPLDLMEAVRPRVDGYLLALLRDRVFRASDFHETQRGNVRLLAPLTHELAETMPAWRGLVGPVAEHVVAMLLKSEPKLPHLPTPLTEANRRADRVRRHGAGREAARRQSRPEPRCKRCGGPLPHRERVYCDGCLPDYRREQYDAYAKAGVSGLSSLRDAGADPSHGGDAGKRRGATQSRQQRERREWEAANPGASFDPESFTREILPRIQGVPLSELARMTGLSLLYVSQIRRGVKVPHPRHWPSFAPRSRPRSPS